MLAHQPTNVRTRKFFGRTSLFALGRRPPWAPERSAAHDMLVKPAVLTVEPKAILDKSPSTVSWKSTKRLVSLAKSRDHMPYDSSRRHLHVAVTVDNLLNDGVYTHATPPSSDEFPAPISCSVTGAGVSSSVRICDATLRTNSSDPNNTDSSPFQSWM